MIRPPRRSVTRFFIPLIDVLILLFCIFLLMPIVEEGAAGGTERRVSPGQLRQMQQELDRLRQQVGDLRKTRESPEELRRRIAQLENDLKAERKAAVAERLVIRTFRIDPKNGALTYDGVVVRNQEDALALIDRDRRKLADQNRELVYLILYPPHGTSLFPTGPQREDYTRWFRGVTLRWDVPGQGPGGGANP